MAAGTAPTDDFVQGFDALLGLEQGFARIGRQQGSESARQTLIASARAHGRSMASRLAFEPGYYEGFVEAVLDLQQRRLIECTPRAARALDKLQKSIGDVRQSLSGLDRDQALSGRTLLMRRRFAILVRALGLHDQLQVRAPASSASQSF